MKKTLVMLLCLLFAMSSVVPVFAEENEEDTEAAGTVDYSKYEKLDAINVFNWAEYISDGTDGSIDVNKEFTKLTGIKVNYPTFSTNEELYTALINGKDYYDVIIPSDYIIDRLINENRLEELDFSLITNYGNIVDAYKNTNYDPDNKYSVPYNVGMIGIIYNTKKVTGTPDSWSLMWDEQYKGRILQFDNERDAFCTAQMYLGLDPNSTNKADWDKARDKLVEQKPLLKGYVMDEIFLKMQSNEADIGTYYAGDFFSMYEENNDLAFYYPKEGTNTFIDAMCVPKVDPNRADAELYKEAAMLYINFLLEKDIAIANAEKIYYASPNRLVIEDEDYRQGMMEVHEDAISILYPENSDYKTVSFKNMDQEMLGYISELWEEVQSSGNDYTVLYIIVGVILAATVTFFIINSSKKKKRAI